MPHFNRLFSTVQFFFAIFFFLTILEPAYAERVKTIKRDGIMQLDNGQFIALAGIKLSSESIRTLPVFVAGRDVELDKKGDGGDLANPIPVYLYAEIEELDLSQKINVSRRKKRVLINEVLLAIGAGRVDEDSSYERKDDFLRIQDEARKKGEGIWSYDS